MMITRFKAESKSKFTVGERLVIGAASMIGIPYRAVRDVVDVGRTHYYELGHQVRPILDGLTATG